MDGAPSSLVDHVAREGLRPARRHAGAPTLPTVCQFQRTTALFRRRLHACRKQSPDPGVVAADPGEGAAHDLGRDRGLVAGASVAVGDRGDPFGERGRGVSACPSDGEGVGRDEIRGNGRRMRRQRNVVVGGAPVFESSPRRLVCPPCAVGASGFHRSPDPGGDMVG